MAANGAGEFFWVRDAGNPGTVGANVYSLMDARAGVEPEEITRSLFDDLCAWATGYMAAEPKHLGETWNLDWVNFNKRGMELARRVKQELGSSAVVQYARGYEDPAGDGILLVLDE